eukprot:GGOE01003872.1.p1 GENE.GGOE01003872.1~~GGOE01003872.1.p1  ORF type:complete len:423 (-),score=132.39 GGOE01003872.1:491-1738(-)
MSTFSWLNPYNVVSYLMESIFGASPDPATPAPDTRCLGLPSVLVLGVPHPLKENICRQLAATYGLQYINAWHELTKAGLGEDEAAVHAALAAHQPLPIPAVVRIVERLLLGQTPTARGFLLDSFPLTLDALLAVEGRLSGAALLVLHFDSPAMAPLGQVAAAEQLVSGTTERVPTEEQSRAYRYGLEVAATHYESKSLLQRLDVAQGEVALLAELHKHLGRAKLCCMDAELEDLVSQLSRDPVDCLCTIARNLAENSDERYRRINIKTERFQQHMGRYPFAMRLLERLGFESDQPSPGIASVVTEPPAFVAYTVHILCQQRARLLSDHHVDDWNPSEALSPKAGGCMFASLGSTCPVSGASYSDSFGMQGGGGCPFASMPAPSGTCPVSGKSAPGGTCPVSGMSAPPMDRDFSAV